MNWINIFGLIIVALMLVPNIIYAYRNKNIENKCNNQIINILEQIGRYGSMLLMVFNIGIFEFGFKSEKNFLVWFISMKILLILYWAFWILYLKTPKMLFAMLLAIIPSIIFVFSGLILRHGLLAIFGIIFSFGHIFVTYQNNKS